MRRALALLVLALASFSFAWNDTGGSWVTHWSDGDYKFTYWMMQAGGFWSSQVQRRPDVSGICTSTGTLSVTGSYTRSVVEAQLDAHWSTFQTDGLLATCLGYDPFYVAPPAEPLSEEWSNYPDSLDRGWYRMREWTDGYESEWATICGGSSPDRTGQPRMHWHYTSGDLAGTTTYEGSINQDMDMYAAAVNAKCDVHVPIPPDDPAVACTGLDGIACERTLQDIRYILGQMLARDQLSEMPSGVEDGLPAPGEDVVGDSFSVPPFDRSQPSWDEWVAPELTDAALDEMVERIDAAWATLRATAETRYPFGMVSWIPTVNVASSAACEDFEMTVLAVTQDLGWCTSAPYTFLTGPARTAILFLVTIAFVFAVMRTVSFA
jgi:hypothetical protein